MVEAVPQQFTPGNQRNGNNKKQRGEGKNFYDYSVHLKQNRGEKNTPANDGVPTPLKFKISLDLNEKGKPRIVEDIEKCDFATLFAKAKEMCSEHGVSESECKLIYKSGRDKVICQDESDLQLAIQAEESAARLHPKIIFKINANRPANDEESKRERRGPGPFVQAKKHIATELEKQVEDVVKNLLESASEQHQPAAVAGPARRKPKHIIKDVTRGFAMAFKNNNRAAAENSAPIETQVADFMRMMQEQNPEEYDKILTELAQAKNVVKDPEAKKALKEARAVIVRKPEDTIYLQAGEMCNVEVEILNDTTYAWK